ncbi:MAG TPA: serine protease [Actinophytocola sp.]|jgi:secreted trypsin-like serine protease|uniref:S1 family peptidase n=1 Tax=Actinophytocola sp. TaxID=1872138 RepID=UPI002F927C26
MGGTSRITRLLIAAGLLAAGIAAIGLDQAGADQEIVGGDRASITDHGYTVFLTTADGFQYCGGTLVDDDKVVTAAHCAVGHKPADVVVVAGREDKESDAGTTSPVTKIWVHPAFTDVRSGSDVAVLTLGKQLPYETVDPASEDDVDLYAPGVVGTILGWGRTSVDGDASRFLRKAEVPMIADASCEKSYPAFKPAAMVCAGVEKGGVDTCQGDSGGPLIVEGELAGITSWGEGCAAPGKPGVYTRVAAYHDVLAEQI